MHIGQFVLSWTANLSFSRDEQIPGDSEAEKEHRLQAHVSAVPNPLQVRMATLDRDC
jgi:hypothetical protein